MDLVKTLVPSQIKEGLPQINIGDSVRVQFTIIEGKTERIQAYEGTVIARNNEGVNETITVRKISYGVGVERVFPINSPRVAGVDIVRRGKVRRAKLYYLRGRVGKKAKVKDLIKKKSTERDTAEA